MSCAHHVAQALESIPGIGKVDLPGWQSTYAGVMADENISPEMLAAAVEAAGYTARAQERQATAGPTSAIAGGEHSALL